MAYQDDEDDDDRCSSNESASPRASKSAFDEVLEETEEEDEEEEEEEDEDDDAGEERLQESIQKKIPTPPRRAIPGRSSSMCPGVLTRSAPSRTSSSDRMAELLGLPSREPEESQPPEPRRRPPTRSYSARISSTSSHSRMPPSRQRSGEQLAQMLQVRPAAVGRCGGDDGSTEESAPVNRLASLQRQTSRRMMLDVTPRRPSRRSITPDSSDEEELHRGDIPPAFVRRAPMRSTSISRPVS
jgi:hypothetical protein